MKPYVSQARSGQRSGCDAMNSRLERGEDTRSLCWRLGSDGQRRIKFEVPRT
jgi:hypothetical protein